MLYRTKNRSSHRCGAQQTPQWPFRVIQHLGVAGPPELLTQKTPTHNGTAQVNPTSYVRFLVADEQYWILANLQQVITLYSTYNGKQTMGQVCYDETDD